jgi:glycosyltransferase involved in cell wall biosynthesis
MAFFHFFCLVTKSSTILHIASWYPNPHDSRLGNFVEEHLHAIHPLEPVVVLSAFEHTHFEIKHTQLPFEHLQVLYPKKLPFISHYLALRKGYKILEAAGHNFQLAHLHVCWPSGMVFLGFLRKLPFCITEHYSGYQKKRRAEWSKMAQFLALRVFNRAQTTAPVSQQLAQSLHDFGLQGPIKVIGNVVNTQVFGFQKALETGKYFRFLHISSLQQKTKNILGLLNAFESALQKDSFLHLSIGGDGDIDWLKAEVGRRKIPSLNIKMLPALSRAEVAKEMAGTKVFVLNSFIENQPVVLLESLCVGRPVIATAVGGIPEFIDEHKGLLIEPNCDEGLCKAMLSIKANYHHFEHLKISQDAHTRHSYSAIAKQFGKLYTSVRP